MKKIYFLIFFSILCLQDVFGDHIKGGWIFYEYLGPGITDPTKQRYLLGLNYYIDCASDLIENEIAFTIFKGAPPYDFVAAVDAPVIFQRNIENCSLTTCYPCLTFIPTTCYNIIRYEVMVELTPSAVGFIVSKQRCCRIIDISNLVDPSDGMGSTYTINIPGVVTGIPNAHNNKSPQYRFNDTSIVCGNNSFSIDFSATDADGDSLVYSFCDAFNGGTPADANPNTADPPPYAIVAYQSPFSGTQPLGGTSSINPRTGIISGTAPPGGEYVIAICVDEYRGGIKLSSSRKELQLKIADCTPSAATLDPDLTTCGDLTLTFSNQTDNTSIQKWFWTFGDPASGASDSSTSQFPLHTFSTAGVYNVKLVVNRGLPCTDSAIQMVNVFPGFFPGFAPLAPFCVGQPVRFDDSTRTNYGTVSNWSWNFGDPATLGDTSHLQDPTYTYNVAGTYTIKLVSGNSKGCMDTASRVVSVAKPPLLNVYPQDTTYCGRDSLKLTATGTGTFSWTPTIFITGANTATPFVFPSTQAKYFVTLDNQGCHTRDSISVTPVIDLTNSITASPANICEGDTLTLTGSSNRTNVTWQWSPPTQVASSGSQATLAFPVVNTAYTLTTRWGNNCIATATKAVNVTPLALSSAGPDTSYCAGQAGITLNASGGTSYQWLPAAGLSNPNIANPIATPAATTTYIVSVGVSGCSRRKPDTVVVIVRPKPLLQMPRDTLICVIDTLHLIAGGTGSFVWTPDNNISSTIIQSPFVSPDAPTTYHVRLTDIFNCFINDSVFIDVKLDVTVNAGNDTSICSTQGLQLNATGDGLSYSWSPTLGLSNPNIRNPLATPAVTTLYTVTANIGKCQRSSDVNITVAPLPKANAGPDATVCIGFNAQLGAAGGGIYSWSPPTYLSDPAIANPQVIQPQQSVLYVVTVSDTLGCARTVKDSAFIKVIPELNVEAGPSDTSIVKGEPLFLSATGGNSYVWMPGTWLNNPTIPNPVSTAGGNIIYTVTGIDGAGCRGTDTIRVTVFELDPDMYVPTAFTPNGDGVNDIIKPILLGMRKLNFFKIFNRQGEVVFETRQIGRGWNGVYKGKQQNTSSFVWIAEGITFKNETKQQKGNVILIR